MSGSVTFDVYQVLEVSQSASQREIKAAYHRLALAHHPDKNQNNEEATAKFQQIGAAYETISDPARKADYDARSAFSSYPSSAGSSPDRYRYSGSDSEDSFEFYGFGGKNNFPFNFSFGGFSFVFGDGPQRQASEESEDDRELHEFQERLQRLEKARKDRKDRLAAARARVDAEEAAAKAQKMAKDAEENRLNARKMENLKQERATQEEIWEKVNATTTAERQANCKHTGFWPKEQQKRKFKCMECGQKRGMTAFKCPYCALMVCQLCLKKKTV